MKNVSLGLAQSSADIQYYEKLIKSGENVEIISIHPYATYYIEKNNLDYKVIEDYFDEKQRDILYSTSLKKSNSIVDKIDNIILEISQCNALKLANSEYIDADLINPVLIKIRILEFLKQDLNFYKIYITNNINLHKPRDKMLYYSYTSWYDTIQEFSIKNNIIISSFDGKQDNFDYPYSFFEKNRELLKKIIPNTILMKRFLSYKNKYQKSNIKSNKQTILFLERVGPLEVLFDELIRDGYRILYYDAQKSIYDPNKIFIYDSDINDYISIDFNFKDIKKQFNLYYQRFTNSELIKKILSTEIENYDLNSILNNKLNNLFYKEIWHSYLVANQFKVIIKEYEIDLSISLETYKTFINPIIEMNSTKHLLLFHGPRYSIKNAKYSVLKSINRAENIFIDGDWQRTLYSKVLQNTINLYTTGNSIYSSTIIKNNNIKYDILYMNTKLDPSEIIFHTDFSNNLYIKDSFKIVKWIDTSKYQIAVKFKPMAANIGLNELPYLNELDKSKLNIFTTEISAQELMQQSKVILLDSLGTSLLQALSLNKIVVLYNPYKSAISDEILSVLKNATYYCENLKQLFTLLENIDNLEYKDNKELLELFAYPTKQIDINKKYKLSIERIFDEK